MPNIFYLDPVNGNDANNGSSWALAWKTWGSGATAARIAPGDTIRIAKSPDPVPAEIDATFTNHGGITLESALTKDICNCDSAWTPSTNVSQANEVFYRKEGTYAQKLTIGSSFTTGKIAYFDLGSSKDFSAYQKISFNLNSGYAINADVLKICLCSDAAGDVIVDSFNIPLCASYGYGGAYYHNYYTIDKGSALGNSIRSIAIYANSDPGSLTLYLDNFIACNDFSLNSLIGKNDGIWYAIQSISSDTTISVGCSYYGGSTSACLYEGTSETVPLYYRNPVLVPGRTSGVSDEFCKVMDSGTAGNLITFSGGWNTSTTEQDGDTWYDCIGAGYAISFNQKDYIKIEHIGVVRANTAFYMYGNYLEVSDIYAAGCGGGRTFYHYSSANGLMISGDIILTACYCSTSALLCLNDDNDYYVVCTGDLSVLGCKSGGDEIINFGGPNLEFLGDITVGHYEGANAVVQFNTNNCYIKKLIYVGSGSGDCLIKAGYSSSHIEIDEIRLDANVNYLFQDVQWSDSRINYLNLNGHTIDTLVYNIAASYSYNYHNGIPIDIYGESGRWLKACTNGIISDQITGGQNAAWAYGESGSCLYLNPNSTTKYLPYVFYVPVTAGNNYQVHFRVKKTSSAANCTLSVDRISGCGITEIDDASVTLTDSWTEYTSSSFTPTLTGFVRVEFHALDGSTTGDIGIDDIHLQVV